MFELFANPANMVIGGALIGSPILIHLINRMRFKRVRWAAMEFLLKSQKRNRRRLIIEQMILLLLRILLVLLTGLLLARYLGASIFNIAPKNMVHVVILDDRLSMSDQWKTEAGTHKNSFEVAKQLVETEIAKNALRNKSAQHLVVVRLSEVVRRGTNQEPDESKGAAPTADSSAAISGTKTLFDRRLNEDALKDLRAALADSPECSQMHLNLALGIDRARDILGKHGTEDQALYLVSDFRQRHWFDPEATALLKSLDQLKNVKIFMIDAADPKRTENQKVPLYHDNLAIAELRPETRMAAQNSLVQFKLAVANHGASERKGVRVTVKVNGSERPEASQTMPSLKPGKVTDTTFLVSFDELGYNQITAQLENEDFGLPADNLRFAVIEIRKHVPVLVIDGDLANGDKSDGDTFYLRTLFNAARGYEIVRGGVGELERPNLDQYASIYILNVRELTSDKQLHNLENYVRDGGGVAFFMGDRVTHPDYYNKKLYANGKGIFPAPLADQPSKPLSDDEKRDKVLQFLDPNPPFQLFVRQDDHPIFKNTEIEKYRVAFRYLNIDRHFPVSRQKWKIDSNRQIDELMTLPNERPVADYESRAHDLLKEFAAFTDAKYAKYLPGLERHRRDINGKLGGKSLAALASSVEDLLKDKGGQANDAENPNLQEFWERSEPAVAGLRERFELFRNDVQYGDPLMIASTFGKGRSVAVFTTAGRRWNDWAAGGPASFTFPMVMLEMQKYLSSMGDEANLTVGTPRQFELDSSRYLPNMRSAYQPESKGNSPVKPVGDNTASAKKSMLRPIEDKAGISEKGRLRFEFDETSRPGIYYYEMKQRSADAGVEPKTETVAFAYNVDVKEESDLRRASKTELEKVAPAGTIFLRAAGAPGGDNSEHKSDLSESGWLYLVLLIILVVEQALAVHLSFHLRGNEAPLPGLVARSQTSAA